MKVYSAGLANLLKGDKTVTLSTGLSLTARRLTLTDHALIESVILEKRAKIDEVLRTIEEVLKNVKSEDMKRVLLMGSQQAIEDIVRSLGIVTIAEASQFENSRIGNAWYLFLACREKSAGVIESVEDAHAILAMSRMEDLDAVSDLIEWATMFDALKNSDGPAEISTNPPVNQ